MLWARGGFSVCVTLRGYVPHCFHLTISLPVFLSPSPLSLPLSFVFKFYIYLFFYRGNIGL